VRDYIHVEDLSRAHVAVLGAISGDEQRLYNLGIGRGYSVKELIAATERVCGHALNVSDAARVPGEAAMVYCDPAKVKAEIGWEAEITDIDTIVRSAYDFMVAHPGGY
jgi:UDP-glucose 4-epimerase